MRAHAADVGVLKMVCAALLRLLKDHDANQALAARAGAIDAVLVAIQTPCEDGTLPAEQSVQYRGLVLLTALFRHAPRNEARAADAGGLEAVLRAMQLWPDHADVQKRGCLVLHCMCCSAPALQQRARAAGAHDVAAAVLQRFPGSDAAAEARRVTKLLRR
jgi:hypothetical protein